eukprot:4472777-Prymnesium_polylepis.4
MMRPFPAKAPAYPKAMKSWLPTIAATSTAHKQPRVSNWRTLTAAGLEPWWRRTAQEHPKRAGRLNGGHQVGHLTHGDDAQGRGKQSHLRVRRTEEGAD